MKAAQMHDIVESRLKHHKSDKYKNGVIFFRYGYTISGGLFKYAMIGIEGVDDF